MDGINLSKTASLVTPSINLKENWTLRDDTRWASLKITHNLIGVHGRISRKSKDVRLLVWPHQINDLGTNLSWYAIISKASRSKRLYFHSKERGFHETSFFISTLQLSAQFWNILLRSGITWLIAHRLSSRNLSITACIMYGSTSWYISHWP